MLKLCIIEDEASARKGVLGLLDWAALGIEIAGEAEDGQDGIALIERVKPDIIICDVRMPRLDGIALVAHIRPAFPDLQVIFLSGHSEKAYLRSAIRFGAVDYLDKPVAKEELQGVIETACARLQARRSPENGGGMQALADLLLGKEGAALPGALPVDFAMPYAVLTFQLGLRPDASGDAPDAGLYVQRHLGEYARALAEVAGTRSMLHAMGGQYIGYMNTAQPPDSQRLAAGFGKALGPQWPLTSVGVSLPHTGAAQLAGAYHQAQMANQSFLMGYGVCTGYHAALAEKEPPPGAGAVDKISALLTAQQFSKAAETLDGYVALLRRHPGTDEAAVRRDMHRLALQMTGQYRPGDQTFQFTVMDRLQRECLCLADIHDLLRDLLGNLVSSLDSLSSKGRVVYDVERYIQAHYGEELSIADIAGQVYLTPTYLCYLYKKATGRTLNTYITQVKLRKAEELLRDSTLKLSDIAAMLGYSSQNYLTRIFTKAYGMTPTAYRNSKL